MEYFALIVLFLVLGYLVDLYVDLRQYRCYAVREVPGEVSRLPALSEKVTPESFRKSQDYGRENSAFGIVSQAFDATTSLLVLRLGALPWLWALSRALLERVGFGFESSAGDDRPHEIAHSLVFAALSGIGSHLLTLPFTLYRVFWIEERYGFNKQTLRLFLADQAKVLALAVVVGGPVLSGVVWILSRAGGLFWLWIWVFLLAVTVGMVVLYPVLVLPLFNKLEPLPDGELRQALEALARKTDFPFAQIMVMDGSKRSGHSNAFFTGFGRRKRIVLYDTLVKQMSTGELVAVLAHEIGHFKRSHIYKLLAITELYQLVFFYVFGKFVNDTALYAAFGFGSGFGGYCPVLVGLTLFMMIYSPVDSLFRVVINAVSRAFEYQADAFSVPHGDLAPALAKMQAENLGSLVIDPVYSTFHHSHPTIVERLHNLDLLRSKSQ